MLAGAALCTAVMPKPVLGGYGFRLLWGCKSDMDMRGNRLWE